MKSYCLRLMGLVFLVATMGARAELTIEITQGVDNPTPIAVVPFAWKGSGAAPADVAQVIDGDLARSGQFAPVSRGDMLVRPGNTPGACRGHCARCVCRSSSSSNVQACAAVIP